MSVWQLIAENKIQHAIQEGEFADLPGMGKPLACLNEPFSHSQWLRDKARREELNVLPPALQLRVDVAKRLTTIAQLKTEADVRDALTRLNTWIDQQNLNILWGPPSSTLPVNIDAFVRDWQNGSAGG